MIDHQESVFVNCVMHNVFKFMIIDSLWHLWVWLKAKVELRLCRLSMRRSQAMRWSQAMIDSNTTVTWQQHWFVYMLVSNTHRNFAYVGETACIKHRLQQHNTGHGSNFTNNPQLCPWMCFVLVYRFPENGDHQANITARKSFEISMAHTQRSRSPSKHSYHLHEWLNCLQPHASTLPKSNLGRTLDTFTHEHLQPMWVQTLSQHSLPTSKSVGERMHSRMGNASSHHQNPSSTTVILQAQEHNTKLCATSKQFKTCTSTLKSLQQGNNLLRGSVPIRAFQYCHNTSPYTPLERLFPCSHTCFTCERWHTLYVNEGIAIARGVYFLLDHTCTPPRMLHVWTLIDTKKKLS